MSLLRVENLTVEFSDRSGGPKKILLEKISLEVGEAEILALVGESGSGKTMTALSILNLLPAGCRITGGRIFWKEQEIGKGGPKDWELLRGGQIGLIFQDPLTAFNPVRTIGSQIQEVLEIHFHMSPRAAWQRGRDFLARVHLAEPEKIVSRYSFELSGGQLQRCAIALTMAAEPRLLIADEPTTALDVITQNKIISLLKEIYGRFGTSILFISHDLALVKRLAQRVAVMQAGEVVETGPVEKIFLNPEKNYTRQLVESIPVLRRF